VGHGASGMGVQAVAGPAFELGGIVAAEEMARARRYEGAALQHNGAKIRDTADKSELISKYDFQKK